MARSAAQQSAPGSGFGSRPGSGGTTAPGRGKSKPAVPSARERGVAGGRRSGLSVAPRGELRPPARTGLRLHSSHASLHPSPSLPGHQQPPRRRQPAHQAPLQSWAACSRRWKGCRCTCCDWGSQLEPAWGVGRALQGGGGVRRKRGEGRVRCRAGRRRGTHAAFHAMQPHLQLPRASSKHMHAERLLLHPRLLPTTTAAPQPTRRRRQLGPLLGAAHALRVELPGFEVGVQHKHHLVAGLEDVLAGDLGGREGRQRTRWAAVSCMNAARGAGALCKRRGRQAGRPCALQLEA